MRVKGEPRMIDKHLMNNKRFALTVNEDKQVQMWKLDQLECVKTFPEADFAKVK